MTPPTPSFTMGSPTHLATSATCVALIAAAAYLGRRWRTTDPTRERTLRIAWIALLIPAQGINIAWWLAPANFDIKTSLPIHVCDLVVWAAPFALLTTWRFPRAILWFGGVGLSSMAFILPTLTRGPAHPEYWLFWIAHTQIVGSAIYLVAAMKWRPTKRDLAAALVALTAYTAAILPINFIFNLDYGYVGPQTTSAAAAFGDVPTRLPAMLALEAFAFVLLYMPFAITRRQSPKPDNHPN